MKIFSGIFKKNSFDSIKTGELKKSAAKLDYQLKKVKSERNNLERQINILFSEASALQNNVEIANYTLRLRTISESWQLKNDTCLNLEKDYSLITTLISVREQQKTLNEAQILNKIDDLNPEMLENWYAKLNVKSLNHRKQVDELSDITRNNLTEGGIQPVDESFFNSLLNDLKDNNITVNSAKNKFFDKLSSQEAELSDSGTLI
ncbi:hypothetical protein [Methanoplanus endosymbiosus]|uniref:Uncharacterized protein n=1 Tax=Methanoplanus endosymbiosus TaxID=33865 RepID=A0A9E7PQZ2_9EURY|nr:hypothetical protein [Methanoplanus endosymbiosus]UUX93737.1 hypothetical protein L6E24_06380 [Methanoplanus endosymbiosus]